MIAGAVYFALHHHIVFVGGSVNLLEKAEPSISYTIFSTQGKSNRSILAIDELRENGIGDLLLEERKITKMELKRLLAEFEEED